MLISVLPAKKERVVSTIPTTIVRYAASTAWNTHDLLQNIFSAFLGLCWRIVNFSQTGTQINPCSCSRSKSTETVRSDSSVLLRHGRWWRELIRYVTSRCPSVIAVVLILLLSIFHSLLRSNMESTKRETEFHPKISNLIFETPCKLKNRGFKTRRWLIRSGIPERDQSGSVEENDKRLSLKSCF